MTLPSDFSVGATVAEMRRRLSELRPVVEEYWRIEAAIAVLEGRKMPKPSDPSRWDGRRTTGDGTNPDGEAALLAMIRERPGMTAGDVQVNAKMPRHTAYRYLRHLIEKGLVERRPSHGGNRQTGHYAVSG